MPSSDPANIPAIVQAVTRLRPNSILDLGMGYGKYGLILREYLDVNQGRFNPDDWQVCIHGVEGFEPYLQDFHRGIYDDIRVENFVEQVDFYEGYDLVLLIDTLEHLPQDQGHSLLHSLLSRNQYVLVSTPNSPYPQGAVHGNELETHRSEWRAADFAAYRATVIFEGLCHIYLIQGATWL